MLSKKFQDWIPGSINEIALSIVNEDDAALARSEIR